MCLPVKPFRIEREWEHAGLNCAVTQAHEAGHRCGYVRVPPGHPLHGKKAEDTDLVAHGGVNFAQPEPCAHDDGEGWWFGFDCAHLGDALFDLGADRDTLSANGRKLLETIEKTRRKVDMEMRTILPTFAREEHFWTQAEVERECESLAEQLAAIGAECH